MPVARIVFMGTPDLAAICLSCLLQARELEVVAVVSQPDRPKGRHLHLQPTPVKSIATDAGLPVLQPEKTRDVSFLTRLCDDFLPDLIAVAAYGQLLPQKLLDIPPHGCLNVHTSLLPRYRGAAPIQWALLNGDRETGVTIMKIVPALDAGDIVNQSPTEIARDDDAQTLHDRLAKMGGDLLVRTIPDYIAGKLSPQPQPTEGVVYARKITKADGHINWTQSATHIWNRVRALVPWPGAYTHFETPSGTALLKLWKVQPEGGAGQPGQVLQTGQTGMVIACGEGSVRLTEVQPEGKRRMTAQAFLAGHSLEVGDFLGRR